MPSGHYGLEFDQPRGWRWLGFHIQWNGVTFYHSGDTIIYPDYLERLRALPRIDVGLLAANGRDAWCESEGVIGNLHPKEAVWLAKEFGWDMLIGGHTMTYSCGIPSLPAAWQVRSAASTPARNFIPFSPVSCCSTCIEAHGNNDRSNQILRVFRS